MILIHSKLLYPFDSDVSLIANYVDFLGKENTTCGTPVYILKPGMAPTKSFTSMRYKGG